MVSIDRDGELLLKTGEGFAPLHKENMHLSCDVSDLFMHDRQPIPLDCSVFWKRKIYPSQYDLQIVSWWCKRFRFTVRGRSIVNQEFTQLNWNAIPIPHLGFVSGIKNISHWDQSRYQYLLIIMGSFLAIVWHHIRWRYIRVSTPSSGNTNKVISTSFNVKSRLIFNFW